MVIVFLGVIEMEMAEVLLATLEPIFVLIAEMFSQIWLNMFFFIYLSQKWSLSRPSINLSHTKNINDQGINHNMHNQI